MKHLFAYLIVDKNSKEPLYAGQGTWYRAGQHCLPSVQRLKYNSRETMIGLSILANDRQNAIDFEKELILKYNPPYNIARWSTAGGIIRSLETRQKMSAAKTGIKHTAASRKKMGDAHRGKPLSPEHRKALSEAAKKSIRLPHTAQARANMVKGQALSRKNGNLPWNKGLTKKDHPALKQLSNAMLGNRNGYREKSRG